MNKSKKENYPAIKENEIDVDESIKLPEMKSVQERFLVLKIVQEKTGKDLDFVTKLKEGEGENVCDVEEDSFLGPVIQRLEPFIQIFKKYQEKIIVHMVILIFIMALLFSLDDGGLFAQIFELIEKIWYTKPIVDEPPSKSYFDIVVYNILNYLKKLVNF